MIAGEFVVLWVLLLQSCPLLNDQPCRYLDNWSGYAEYVSPQDCERARYQQGDYPEHFKCAERIVFTPKDS